LGEEIYAEDVMEGFGEAEDVGDVERTKVVVEVVVHKLAVDSEEDGLALRAGCLVEEC
jgi:hypothetical protein